MFRLAAPILLAAAPILFTATPIALIDARRSHAPLLRTW